MSNYLSVDYEDANPQLKAIYDEYQAITGNVKLPNWLKYLGQMPQVLKGAWILIKSVMIEGQLSPLLQELIFYSVAYHRSAPYCMTLHGQNLLRITQGLTIDDLAGIVTGNSHGYLPKKYEKAAVIAGELATATCSMSEADFAELIDMGFSQDEAMEITMLVSVAVFFNTYAFAADLPIEK
jgi:alkylhydroperoxidase family enzyme